MYLNFHTQKIDSGSTMIHTMQCISSSSSLSSSSVNANESNNKIYMDIGNNVKVISIQFRLETNPSQYYNNYNNNNNNKEGTSTINQQEQPLASNTTRTATT